MQPPPKPNPRDKLARSTPLKTQLMVHMMSVECTISGVPADTQSQASLWPGIDIVPRGGTWHGLEYLFGVHGTRLRESGQPLVEF